MGSECISDCSITLFPIEWRRGNIALEVWSEASCPLQQLSGFHTYSQTSELIQLHIVDVTVRNEILKSLPSSGRLLNDHFVDQSEYLERHSETLGLGLEQDARYFWIFRNLDYEKWVRGGGEAKILGLHGPSTEDLELAASHIVRSVRDPAGTGQGGEVLYFFYNSIECERDLQNVVDWRDLACVWNLLRQLIESRPTAAEKLLQTFLKTALGFLGDDELIKLRAHGPTEDFRSLFRLSKPRDLWDAFGQVFGDLGEPRKQNLTLIIDLNSMTGALEGLVGNIRKMIACFPKAYGTVRVLLSNLPETWQHRPSEVLLEHDKERKGMYSPWYHILDTLP